MRFSQATAAAPPPPPPNFPEAEVKRMPGMTWACLIVHGWGLGIVSIRT